MIEECISLFLVLIVSPNTDEFTIEVAYSSSDRLPSTSFLIEREAQPPELCFRISHLTQPGFKMEHWWRLAAEVPPEKGIELLSTGRPTEEPVAVARERIAPVVDACIAAVGRYVVPFFEMTLDRLGVRPPWRA